MSVNPNENPNENQSKNHCALVGLLRVPWVGPADGFDGDASTETQAIGGPSPYLTRRSRVRSRGLNEQSSEGAAAK